MGFKEAMHYSAYKMGKRMSEMNERRHIKKLNKKGYIAQRSRIFYELEHTDPNSEAYSQLLKNLEILERNNATYAGYNKVSADTKAYIVSKGLLCAGIVAYEQNNVISTKATSVLNKWRDK